ncbi:hypothetical protein GCM10011499_08440 [Pelagibacterium lentulum]|uniref:Uncharacterized protein n=1 Tax=Pelagibacterium lentulum TaxID=2029865 RepID=A0A916RAP3_9HYPH|nr:hypothetical protein GCM10011499_08440 [Pelagibacterium lentulum]
MKGMKTSLVEAPLICSFYTPGGYYKECAIRLKDNVERLGLRHEIVRKEIPEGAT